LRGNVFSQVPLSGALLALGVASALLGTVLCATQRHLKRLLAYSTIAHVGLFLCGLSTVDSQAIAGFTVSVIGHAGAKGALFLLAGIMLDRFGSVDVAELFGRARARVEGVLFAIGALAMSDLPPFGTILGKDITEHASAPWLKPIVLAVPAITGAAMLTAGARVYLGLGDPPDSSEDDKCSGSGEEPETGERIQRPPSTMLAAPILLLLVSLACGAIPAVARWAATAGRQAQGYVHDVLPVTPTTPAPPVPDIAWTTGTVLTGLGVTAVACLLAAGTLWRHWLPAAPKAVRRVLHGLHAVHSGHLGDYVAWLLFGVAAVGAIVLV
jgi:multicomponent Na+:H+ antiporter subunit D